MSSSSLVAVGVPYQVYHTSHHSEPRIVQTRPVRKTYTSCTKLIERQVIQAWKRVTEATRKRQRASLPKDFVLVTSRRRASVMLR